tara:strand:+ start:367 stop:990 length:624 start_codon:yes stop_codon:yes gene_type:complete
MCRKISFEGLELESDRGVVQAKFFCPPSSTSAVLMVGGGDGGFDGPASALYPSLAEIFYDKNISALLLDYRIHSFPGDLDEAIYDVCIGIRHLLKLGIRNIGLIGHSFGGAVVIEATVRESKISTVVSLASQTAGALNVDQISPRPILFVHGLDDIRLPPDCSRYLHSIAKEPKELVLFEGATHSLRQSRESLQTLLVEWFERYLTP